MKAFIATLAATSVQAYYVDKYSSLLSMQQSPEFINGGSSFSPITMEVDGTKGTYYVAASFKSTGGSDYVTPADGRGYISTTSVLD